MSHAQSMRHVIVPQAIRRVIPPMLNDFIALMKDTSLVQVIGYVEVVRAGREVQAETFNSSALTLGAVMFIVVTIPLARVVDRLIARQQAQTRRATARCSPRNQPSDDGAADAGGPMSPSTRSTRASARSRCSGASAWRSARGTSSA